MNQGGTNILSIKYTSKEKNKQGREEKMSLQMDWSKEEVYIRINMTINKRLFKETLKFVNLKAKNFSRRSNIIPKNSP